MARLAGPAGRGFGRDFDVTRMWHGRDLDVTST
jgi:hypothetical protein